MHDAYQWVKFLHTGATVLFAGWVFLAPLWMRHALRHAHAAVCIPLRRSLTIWTVVFIGLGAAALLGTGVLMARVLSPEAFDLHWLRTGTWLFAATTVTWLVIVLPLYRRALTLRSQGKVASVGYALLGGAATSVSSIMMLLTLWMMVVKPV